MSFLCALMLINISSCMLGWLHLALPIASSCTFLEFKLCIGRCSKRSTKCCSNSAHHTWCKKYDLNASGLMQFIWALYERCTKRCSYSAPLFPRENRARALYRRCTRALYVQRPRQILVSLIKTTTLHIDTLYICHFDFRSITRVHIQIPYLGDFSKRRKIPKNSFLITQTLVPWSSIII